MGNNKKSSLGGGALKLTFSKFFTAGISLISVMLLSRFLTLEEYGTYAQILLATNILTSLLMLGLPNSINYFLARAESEDEKQKFLSVYYSLSTGLSFIVGLILVLSTPFLVAYFNNPLLKTFIYFFALFPWTKIIMSSIENVLIAFDKISLIILFRITNSFALLVIIFLVQYNSWSFSAYMLLYILIEIVFCFIVYILVKNISKKLTVSFDISIIKKLLIFSLPIGFASAIGTLNIQLDKLMIAKFLNAEQMAIYTNASRELPIAIIATSLTAVLLPQITKLLKKGLIKKAIKIWGSSSTLSFALVSFLTAGIFVFAPDVIILLYSDKYLDGTSVFRIYCLVLLLKFTYFGIILNSIGKTKFIFYSSLASLMLNVVLNYILIKTIGFIGPAIATFLSQVIINIIQLIYTARVLDIKFAIILPWKNLSIILLVNLILGGIIFEIKYILSFELFLGSVIESLLLSLLWAVVYLFIFFRLIKKNWNSLNSIE